MKIAKIIATLLIVLFMITYILPVTSLAATSNNGLASDELLKFKGFTIKKNTTISQIDSKFGNNKKIVGESAFGGKIYTYYDDTYTWSLHIETNANGEIKAYGCIGEGFVSNRYSYGDKEDYRYWNLSGTTVTKRGKDEVIGIYLYNCTNSEANNYWKTFANDSKYSYELQKHAIIVSKILAKGSGYEFPQTYASDEIFYLSEQLKENGTDFYNYSVNTGKTKYISLLIARTDSLGYDYPNPVGLGQYTQGYSEASNYKYMLYDTKILDKEQNKRYTTIVAIDPSFLEEKNTVPLTQKEQELLSDVIEVYELAGQHYEQAQEFYDSHDSYFEIEPVYESTPLTAGKWNDSALQLSTDYLNLARVGMGLTPVTLDDELAEAAQYKATLVTYMLENGMETGHFPEQPEGVSDEFYNKAQSYMTENLFYGNVQDSVINAINDGYGEPVSCGHRYNLLNPRHTKWGVGAVGSGISFGWQSAHKFVSSGNYNDVELVAWPSNGILPLDLVYNGIGNWTAKFYKNYTVSSDTEVTIKCLNSGKVYEINNENKNDYDKFLQATGSRLLTFRDDTIAYEDGDVFEITLHNVKNSSGNLVDYTYRSVFKNMATSGKEVTNINIDTTNVKLGLNQNKKLSATIEPSDATNKLMIFTSSNEKVATVRQDGLIQAVGKGDCIITIKSGDVTKEVKVSVSAFKDVGLGDWFFVAVNYCNEKGIILGATETEFRPDKKITRADLVTILWRMEGEPKVTGVKDFPDVSSKSYYANAVRWATKNKVVNGYNSGKFGPNDNITREQLATILWNYAKYKGKNVTATANTSKFTDWYKVTGYAQNAVKWAVGKGVITGKYKGRKVDPQGTASRAEAAGMIYNYCTKIL